MSKLKTFLEVAAADPRVGPVHISMFCALYALFSHPKSRVIKIKRREVMSAIKVSQGTYHTVIRDLNDFGYISYEPNKDSRFKSVVVLL